MAFMESLLEFVSYTPNRLDMLRVHGVYFYLFAKPPNVNSDGA